MPQAVRPTPSLDPGQPLMQWWLQHCLDGSLPMARIEGPMFKYACHEGNYGLTNILAGSRAQEAAAEAVTQGSK